MTESLNGNAAEAVANLLHGLRPEWGIAGIKTALFNARDRGTAFEVIHAALYAAEDLTVRTPAVIALAGPHWTRGRELGSSNPRGTKCDQPGHEGKPAHNCSYCIADGKARDDESAAVMAGRSNPEHVEMYTRGANAARAMLRGAQMAHGREA